VVLRHGLAPQSGSREEVHYVGVAWSNGEQFDASWDRGAPISCTSTGIGAPSTSIAMEELARCGATTFLRVGTAGTFLDHVRNGDMAIMDGAVRLDGASRLYAPIEYPAVAHHEVVAAAIAAARAMGIRYHVGLTRSADTFYAGHASPGSSYGGYWQSWWRDHFDDLARQNVLAAEMEASLIFVLARLWGLRAGGIAVILDNVRHVSGGGEFDPDAQFEHGADHIEQLADLACEVVRELHEQDASRA
jgi:uridine phosphorylase